jgi:hypothetical protein
VVAAHMCVFDAAEEKLSSKLFTIFHVLLARLKLTPNPEPETPKAYPLSPIPYPLSPIPYPLSPIPYPLSPNP